MDVTQPFLDKLWIGTSKDNGWPITVEYEGNNALCNYCGLLGHTIGLGRKKCDVKGKSTTVEKKKNKNDEHNSKKKKNNH